MLWYFRVEKLKKQFKHLYVVAAVPTREQNDSFNRSYLQYVENFKKEIFTCTPVKQSKKGSIFVSPVYDRIQADQFGPIVPDLLNLQSVKCALKLQNSAVKQFNLDEVGQLSTVH